MPGPGLLLALLASGPAGAPGEGGTVACADAGVRCPAGTYPDSAYVAEQSYEARREAAPGQIVKNVVSGECRFTCRQLCPSGSTPRVEETSSAAEGRLTRKFSCDALPRQLFVETTKGGVATGKVVAPGRQYLGVLAFLERGIASTPYLWSFGALLDGVLERDPGEDLSVALGLRGQLGYRGAVFHDRYLAPDGTELFVTDRTVNGLLLGVSPEVRFARLALWRPAFGAGARIWITAPKESWALGFPVHARLDATISGQWSLAAMTWLAAEWGAGTAYRFTGVGAETRGPARAWGLAWGFAVGLEY